MEDLNLIRQRIRERREALGYSYQNLADLTHLSKSTLQRYETGSIGNLPLDKLENLAHALECSPAYLMGWESNEIPFSAKLIREARDYTGISIEELSNQSGIDISVLKAYEDGVQTPTIGDLILIANVLKVSVYSIADFYTASRLISLNVQGKQIEYGEDYPQYIRMIQAFSYLNHIGAEKAAAAVEDLSKIREYRREEDRD